jgi:hypothetical protein
MKQVNEGQIGTDGRHLVTHLHPPEGAATERSRGRRLLRQAHVADRIACRFDWWKIGSVLTLDSLADTPPPLFVFVDLLTNDDDHHLGTFIDRPTCAISRLSAASPFLHKKILKIHLKNIQMR